MWLASDPDWKIPSKIRLETYLHTVKYGILWVCLSGNPKNALPTWEPEADNPDYLRFTMGPEIWDCSAGRAIENFIDNAHFSFVHRNTFGQESSATQGTEYAFEETDTTMTMAFEYMAANPEGSPIADTSELKRKMHRILFLPFCTRTMIEYEGGREHIIHINIAPISAKRSQLIVVFTRNFDREAPVADLLDWERKILGEDRAMIEKQKPEEIPLEVSIEVHAKAGYRLFVYNRTASKAQALVEAGATLCESPDAVAEACDVIFAIVGFPPDVESVFLGTPGRADTPGRAGSGQHTKMANQIAIASSMLAMCESLRYAQSAGLDPETVLSSISKGAAGSWSLTNLAPRVLREDFAPGFYVKHFIKDMQIAIDSSEAMGLRTPGLKVAKALFDQIAAEGCEEMGTQALFKAYSP